MAVGLDLPPKDKSNEVAAALTFMVSQGATARMRRKVNWLVATLYMQGVREFDSLDWTNGTVTASYSSGVEEGTRMKLERLLTIYQTEIGRFRQIDLSPVVSRRGQGLDGLRKAATSQLVLDTIASKETVTALTETIVPLFLRSGFFALGVFREGKAAPRFEVIPGWELMSSPVEPVTGGAVDAILRIRPATLPWLIKSGVLTEEEAEAHKSLLNIMELPIGSQPTGSSLNMDTSAIGPVDKLRKMLTGKSKLAESGETTSWCQFVELWQRDDKDNLRRYVAQVGQYVAVDHEFDDKVPMPIQPARYLDVGGFGGRGMIEQLIPLNNEAEYLIGQVFANVENWDLYGMLCLSTAMGLSLREVQEARRGEKVLLYTPDVYSPNAQPFVLPPANAGKMPMEMVQIALSLISGQVPQPEMLQGGAPGRVDSASALAILNETSNIPLTAPTEALANCLTRAYRAALWQAKEGWDDSQVVALTLDDDVLVGIDYDWRTGQVTLARDAIPHPDEVVIEVAAKMPRSKAEQKAELKEHLQLQIITPRQYRIQTRVLGLDLPVANEQEWQAWRKAKLENIMLYGKGDTPGQVAVSSRDLHEVHLEVLAAFIARPEYPMASAEVQEAFREHYNEHQDALGSLPEGLPFPGTEDELAQMAQQRMDQEKQMMAGGGQQEQNYRL